MRILLINWAPIDLGTQRGGGVNGYCQSLAIELVGRGNEVVSLSSGTEFDRSGVCRLERAPDWRGIAVHRVLNSPVLAPSVAQFCDPASETAAPELERLIEGFVAELKPGIVHVHNVEGLSAGCIGAVRRGWPGARVLFSLHNYHTICPQVYLLQGHRRPCFSFDNGHACVNCIPAPDPAEERERLIALRVEGAIATAPKQAPASPGLDSRRDGQDRAGAGLLRRIFGRSSEPLPPRFVPGRGPHPWYGDDVPAWKPLLNVVEPEPPSSKPANEYAHRRGAMVAMLNACDRVLAVSDFVARKFESMGVARSRIRVLRIGTRMVDLAADSPPTAPAPFDPSRPGARPIHIAFMGYNNWYKGLPMFADALDLLTPEVLARFHLHISALGGEQMEPILRTIEPRLAGLTLRHGYRYEEIPRLLSGMDLGIVPSVWWDNGPQTVMEFFACGVPVLAAQLGGIPDLVRDGDNGLLFIGNHRWDLARRLAGLAHDPSMIDRLRRGVTRPLSIAEHVSELEDLYRATLSS